MSLLPSSKKEHNLGLNIVLTSSRGAEEYSNYWSYIKASDVLTSSRGAEEYSNYWSCIKASDVLTSSTGAEAYSNYWSVDNYDTSQLQHGNMSAWNLSPRVAIWAPSGTHIITLATNPMCWCNCATIITCSYDISIARYFPYTIILSFTISKEFLHAVTIGPRAAIALFQMAIRSF